MTASQLYNSIPSDQQGAALLVLSAFRYISDLGLAPTPAASATPTDLTHHLTADKEAALREKVVSEIWEPDLRSELVDRIVAVVSSRLVDAITLKAVIRKAIAEKDEYDRTDGKRGKSAYWKTLAIWLKGVYEQNGLKWTSTKGAVEPRPKQPRVAPADLAEVAAEAGGEFDAKPAGRLNAGNLKGLLDGYRVFEKEKKQAQQ